MDQTRALNALEPFLALAKSATSPRAAADLITQATSAPNTYVFAELLQHPNIRKLADDPTHSASLRLLETFAWGTWETYHSTPNLPPLSDAQARKLRLLSLLTIAAEKPSPAPQHNLSYPSLIARLSLSSPLELEQLVTTAIYENLLSASLNPSAQTVVITSVAPLRDLAPGSAATLLNELGAWSARCDSVLAELQAEIDGVQAKAVKRAVREAKVAKQVKGATEGAEKREGKGSKSSGKGEGAAEDLEELRDEDAMEVDAGGIGEGKKRGGKVGGKLSR
ncbi:hypothetical protein WHR41_06189 [Cladosporium halotolerans]|uniref:PCI domain-containing protein n=1 Tax=Cladosporium halotolerans TaxID=1052096 RepID=A0AB34KLK9_9PEZI